MSVLIKNLKIPKSCYDCQFNKGCDVRWFLRNDKRPYDCPLVEVPTPHGRLIDADEIGEEFRAYGFNGKYYGSTFGDLIDAQDTVIEAESE